MVTPTSRDGLALALAVVVGVLAVSLGTPSPAAPARPVALRPATDLVASTDGCASPLPGPVASGTLAVDGGPLGPSASSDVTLAIGYSVLFEVVDVPNGTPAGRGCLSASVNATTGGNGSFDVNLSVPATSLVLTPSGWQSTRFFGPFGPASATSSRGPPAGYAVSTASSDGGLDWSLAFVWELASVTIGSSDGPVVVSAGAPLALDAQGWMANGSRTPLAPSFAWAVTGIGWSFDSSTVGPTVNLTGLSGAPIGSVSVRATAYVGTTLLQPPPAVASLVAVSTAITSGALARTLLDAGTAASLSIEGTGAPGYPYTASVTPGLGVAPVEAPCTSTVGSDGLSHLSCTAAWTYPAAGTAQPSGNLSNGYSTATWQFASVTVAEPPDPSIEPAAAVGYAGTPVRLAVSVANGSGVRPYSRACLDSGDGSVSCQPGPGPWTFSPVYRAAGTYTAAGWTTDAVGTNRSISTPVRIFDPLAVGPVLLESANVTAGGPVALSAVVTGGDLPANVYWNVTGASSATTTSSLATDGTVATTFTPSAAGLVSVSIVVVDALGSTRRATAVFAAAPAPAAEIVTRGTVPSGPVPAGSNVTVTWAAVDALGGAVPTYAAASRLAISSRAIAPELWVNASGAGPLPALGNGTYAVPAAAWENGLLNLTIVSGTVATYSVSLVGLGLALTSFPVNFSTSPDLDHVRLIGPVDSAHADRSGSAFWLVEDRFGNSAPGAVLGVRDQSGGTTSEVYVIAAPLPNGSSGVWINYSAPGTAAGEIVVVDAAGVAVDGPIVIAAAPAPLVPSAVVVAALTVGPLGAAAVGVTAFVRRRRRPATLGSRSDDEELRELAEGRETVLATVRRLGAADLDEIAAAWSPPPAPPAIADWVSSLVADGSLSAKVGTDRRPRFCLGSAAGPPPIEVDLEVLEDALRRRDAEARDQEGSRPTRS